MNSSLISHLILSLKQSIVVYKDTLTSIASNNSKFGLILKNLLLDSIREINNLIEHSDDLFLGSLATRNIFELYLIIRYVSGDEKRQDKWLGQMHKDLFDINNGLRKLAIKRNLPTGELDALEKMYNDAINDSPFRSSGPFEIKTIAAKYGNEEDFDFLFKLTSKLIHPSSSRVNGYSVIAEQFQYKLVVAQMATFYAKEIEELLLEVKVGLD